jgi:hypothetical protein
MEQTQAIGEGLTFEKVWAALMENREQLKETGQHLKETDRQIKETGQQLKASQVKFDEELKASHAKFDEELKASQEKFDRQMEESRAQFDREMQESNREFNKRFGKFFNTFGDMLEYMILPNLVSKFAELDFTFTKANQTEIQDREHGIFLEIDALLENGDKVMAVEVKNKPSIDDIQYHIERMEKLRLYADLHNDKRAYLGAIAGVVFSEGNKIYALKKGLYVIEPSGETFKITEPKGEYHPHEW